MIRKLQFAHIRKFVTALIGAAGIAVSEGLVPDEVGSWLTVVIGFATALGVYGAPNDVKIRRDPVRENLYRDK